MDVTIYKSEKFERSKRRYVIFATVFAAIFLLSIFNQNYVGAIFLFFVLGWYFYYSTTHAQTTTLSLQDDGIKIGKNLVNFAGLTWYVLEMHNKTETLKNIVFVSPKWHAIYTFHDTPERIKTFVLNLDKVLPMMDDYPQSGFEKVIRRLQL